MRHSDENNAGERLKKNPDSIIPTIFFSNIFSKISEKTFDNQFVFFLEALVENLFEIMDFCKQPVENNSMLEERQARENRKYCEACSSPC